jgi:hypothetical protein
MYGDSPHFALQIASFIFQIARQIRLKIMKNVKTREFANIVKLELAIR